MTEELQGAFEIIKDLFFSFHDRITRNQEAIGNLTRGQDEQNEKIKDLEKVPGVKSLEEKNACNDHEVLSVYGARLCLLEKEVGKVIKSFELLNNTQRESAEIREEDNLNFQFCIKDVRGNIESIKREIHGPGAPQERERYKAAMEKIDRREKDLDARVKTLEKKEAERKIE